MHENAERDLTLIRRLMEETRRDVVDRGRHLLIWGALSAIGLLVTWLAVIDAVRIDPAAAWLPILVLGWTASLVVGRRDARRARAGTPGRRLLTTVWVSAAVTLTLIALAGMFGGVVSDRALPGLLSGIIAPPILVTAALTGERWLSWVAVGWWAGSAVMLFLPGVYTLPLMAAMALLFMALPGAVLYARSRRPAGVPLTDAG